MINFLLLKNTYKGIKVKRVDELVPTNITQLKKKKRLDSVTYSFLPLKTFTI